MTDLETQVRSLADRRFAATSPVAFVAKPPIDASRPSQETEIIMQSNDTVQTKRRWYTLGVAAGLIAIVVVAVAFVARNTDPPAPAPAAPLAPTVTPIVAPTSPASAPIELTGAEGDVEAIEAFAAIELAFEAFNTGDALGWATARGAPGGAPTDPADPELEYVAAAHAAGARYDVASCDYGGFDEFPVGGDESDEVADGHRFICKTKMIDAFTAAAGIDFDEAFTWLVANGQVVHAVSVADLTALRGFMSDLNEWVDSEHPDTAFTPIRFYNYPLADEVPAVMGLVAEFVASDDRWPSTGG